MKNRVELNNLDIDDKEQVSEYLSKQYSRLPLVEKFRMAEWSVPQQTEYETISDKYNLAKLVNTSANVLNLVTAGITIANMLDGNVVNSIVGGTMMLAYYTIHAISRQVMENNVDRKESLDAKLESDSADKRLSMMYSDKYNNDKELDR